MISANKQAYISYLDRGVAADFKMINIRPHQSNPVLHHKAEKPKPTRDIRWCTREPIYTPSKERSGAEIDH